MDDISIVEVQEKPRLVETVPQTNKGVYTGTELLNMKIKEVPKLWEPFFPMNGLAGLVGSSDCGKSMLLRQLAIAIVLQQKDFLNFPLHIRHGRALYVCTEDDVEGVAANFTQQIANANPGRLDNIRFLFDTINIIKQLDIMLTEAPADIVIIDVWSDIFVGNPNNWVDTRQSLSPLKELSRKHQCLIVILHHTVKNSEKNAPDKNKLNGSQAIEAKLRSLLELRPGNAPNERILSVLKSNYMPMEQKAEGILLELNPKWLLFTNTGKKVSLSGLNNSVSRSYEPSIWVPKMEKLRQSHGMSFENARAALVKKYGDDAVPGLTWFKKRLKSDSSDGHTILA